MKRILLVLLAWSFLMPLGFAQTKEEYNIKVGDTLVLPLFNKCRSVNYNVSSKSVIDFKPLHYGEKVQVIGSKAGYSLIKASCDEQTVEVRINVVDPNEAVVLEVKPVEKIEKPKTLPFNARYQYNPPTDHFYITFANKADESRETYAKIGDEESYSNGNDIDRCWNVKTGDNWFYVPSAQGWTDDVKWEFEPLGEGFFPLNAFAREINTDQDLSSYYIGMEKVLGIDCWVFFVEFPEDGVVRFWVDPSNGCTLRRQVNNNPPCEVSVYDLGYKKWSFGPHFKKSLHDKTR